MILNVDFECVLLSTGTGHAARMFTPGPIMSGFKILGISSFGPLEEKEATIGADEPPITVPLNKIVAVGAEGEFM